MDVLVQALLHQRRHTLRVRISHAKYPRTGLGETTGELGHIGWITGGQNQYIHVVNRNVRR